MRWIETIEWRRVSTWLTMCGFPTMISKDLARVIATLNLLIWVTKKPQTVGSVKVIVLYS